MKPFNISKTPFTLIVRLGFHVVLVSRCFSTHAPTAPPTVQSPPQPEMLASEEECLNNKNMSEWQTEPCSFSRLLSPQRVVYRIAIWFLSCLRPTTQKDAAESTGILCRSSLYRDLFRAGKPAFELSRVGASFQARPSLLVSWKAFLLTLFVSSTKETGHGPLVFTVDDVSLQKFSLVFCTMMSAANFCLLAERTPSLCFIHPVWRVQSKVLGRTLAAANCWYPAIRHF